MKNLSLLAFIALAIFSCSKENSPTVDDYDGESVAVINVNVNGNLPGSRAIEGGHAGSDGTEILPEIVSVTVIPYNEYGLEISQIDLNMDQIKNSVYGQGKYNNTTIPTSAPAGAMVGLPAGTKKVDVVVNRPAGMNPNKVTNINYFNYRSDKASSGDNTPGTSDNFGRVYLTSAEYGVGKELGSSSGVNGNNIPIYNLEFSVSPSLARLEIHHGIDIKEAETWTDGYGSQWKTMNRTDFETKYAAQNITANPSSGEYTHTKEVLGVSTKVTFRNAVRGTSSNGFNTDLVYFPQYYWYAVNPSASPANLDLSKVMKETDIDDDPNVGGGWVQNEDYAGNGTLVTWYPNMFYAVDVEAIFINNIKVRGSEYAPYMHPWPGSESTTGWLNWYKAYHMGGWHSMGSSIGNTFLCMGNMWDRIAKTKNPATDEQEITFPSISTPGSGNTDKMTIIVGKALPETGKSRYWGSNDRNLGIETDKAAAYQIYEQTVGTNADEDQVRTSLPHVILKVKAYENKDKYAAGDYVKNKEFITIKAFKQGDFVKKFERAKIYRIDLSTLRDFFKGQVPVPFGKPTVDPTDPIDPDPEMPGSQLSVIVEIKPWTIQNITPVI